MPSRREAGQDVTLMALDIVGEVGEQRDFIRHAGLAKNAGTQERNDIPVYHMGPPLEVDRRMTADAVGTAGLSNDEVRRIMDFKDRHKGEHDAITQMLRKLGTLSELLKSLKLLELLPQIYCIYPHAEPFKENDRDIRMRFSCAGFVFEAYREAGILLFDDDLLPPIDLSRMKEAYPDYTQLLDDPNFRASMGLNSAGKWPVMLCGYLLHAINQESTAIRQSKYSPKESDQYFAG